MFKYSLSLAPSIFEVKELSPQIVIAAIPLCTTPEPINSLF